MHHHGPGPAHGVDAHFDRHGNPHDFEHYVSRLDDPSRAEWQKPDEVVKALGLAVGQVVGEIGSGVGTFTKRLASGVGETGRVFAVDVEPRLLAVLRDRLAEARVTNVTPVLGFAEDPLLPPASCDLVLLVNTLHHFADPSAMLKRFAALLKPGGRLANVDFHRRETAMGPPLEQRIARETCVEQARAAGLALASEPTFLEHQYFLLFERA